jgi:serine/threonine-protein kinase RsbW
MEASGHSESRTRFAQASVLADAARAAQLRHEFCLWLKRYFALDETKVSDMVLAVNEALANAAEFAYTTAEQAGSMSLLADYDTDTSVLSVTVSDEGAWRIADGENKKISRGRGIPLMQALADRASIDSTPSGTRVRLEWNQVDAAADAVT